VVSSRRATLTREDEQFKTTGAKKTRILLKARRDCWEYNPGITYKDSVRKR